MKTTYKFLSIFSLIALLALTFATPARAFDGRTGEVITIEADEVIEDDLYVSASEFTLEGTIKGDLVVAGGVITINGTVEGDLIAAGQSVIINGTITDDARIAGAELKVSQTASIGGDLVSAGASLETEPGSEVSGELVVGAGQALLEGNVASDVLAGVGALELNGKFGGDVNAQVGDPEEGGPPPSIYLPQKDIDFPTVKAGFNFGENATVQGNLTYTQTNEVKIPADAVSGKITRTEPVVDMNVDVEFREPPPAEAAGTWAIDLLRSIATLSIFGLILGWLAPLLIKSFVEKAQAQPAASFGWGIVAYASFFFAVLVILVGMLVGSIFFGILSLTGLSATIVWVSLLAISILSTGFLLAIFFVSKIIVAWLSGKLILARINPAMAEHKVWPLLLGAAIVALLIAIPQIGALFGILIMFIGLGAIWLWGREAWQARKNAA